VDPRLKKSKTDTDDPMRAMPTTENAQPSLAKLLSASAEPRLKKSKTDTEEPRRISPKIE
jgi:hypothetical protein